MSTAHPEAVPTSPQDDEKGPESAEAGSKETVNWEGDIHGSPNIDISQVIEGVAPEKYAEALAKNEILKEDE